MKIRRTFSAAAVTAVVVFMAVACLPDRPVSEAQIAGEIGGRLNQERVDRGLDPLPVTVSGSIHDQLWASRDSTAPCAPHPTVGAPESAFTISTCDSSVGSVVQVFMASEGHNKIVTKKYATGMTVGVACVDGEIHFGAWVDDPLRLVRLPDGNWAADDPSAPFSRAVGSQSVSSQCHIPVAVP